eukprot:3585798-Alexandrium_andersonii.AAC.1
MVQSCVCFFRGDRSDRKLQLIRRRISKLKRKRPHRISGKNAYLKSLFGEVQRWRSARRALPQGVAKKICKRHHQNWAAMPRRAQAGYVAMAEDLREQRRSQHAAKLAQHTSELSKLRAMRRQLEEQGSTVLLSRCRFSRSELVDFAALYHSEQWTAAHINDLRAQSSKEVVQPIAPEKATLEMMELPPGDPVFPVPAWARWMAFHRSALANSVVSLEAGGVARYFAFVFATQSPCLVCLSEVQPAEGRQPWPEEVSRDHLQAVTWDHSFVWQVQEFVYSDEQLLANASNIKVLFPVHPQAQRLLVGDGAFEDMAAVQEWLPSPVVASASAPADHQDHKASVDVEPWMADPAVWEFLRDGASESAKPGRGGGRPPHRPQLPLAEDSDPEGDE